MKILRTTVVLMCLLLGPWPAYGSEDLSGHYSGRLGDTPALLELRVAGSSVSGTLSRQDKPDITLKGQVTEGRLIGAVSSSRGSGFFEGYREFGALVIVVREPGAVTGQELESRAEFAALTEAGAAEPIAKESGATIERDRNLAGTWTTQRLSSQGDMVLPVHTEMVLGSDGTYSERNDPDIGSTNGEWRSHSGTIEFRKQGADAWELIGDYRVHASHLITVAPQGEPLVWTRKPD